MCPSINELGLSNDKVGGDVDFDNLPEQFGGGRELLTPGSYRFRLPSTKDLQVVWDKFIASVGERINAIFNNEHPLIIVQSPGGTMNDQPYQTRISNVERARGKEKIQVSDMDYLLKALGFTGKKPTTNAAYAAALVQFGGKEFGGDIEWSWYCNDKKNIWAEDGQGGTKEIEGHLGCGTRYYMKDVPKDPTTGLYPERIICQGNNGQCGASVRAFDQISRFRP